MIAKIVQKYLDIKHREVERFIKNPLDVQSQVFNYLIKNGKHTLIGSKYNFSSIKDKDDFRHKVPVFHYEDLRPYLSKIIQDKQSNILWNKPIKWFAMSSGTTEERSKYIPVTAESLNSGHYRCGAQMLSIYTQSNPDARFFLGKTLVLGGSKQVNEIGDGIFTGDISAILIHNLSVWTKFARTPERVSLIPDWEKKMRMLKRYAIKHDVRAFMGVPSWMLVLLKKIQVETGQELTDIWPNLEVFFHGGVSFTPFLSQYQELIKKPSMNYWETYNASEGFFGVQISPFSKDLLLMLDNNIYYEFVPMNQWEAEKPDTLTLDEVKIGENYALMITTNGGLWRYMIGDTIEFTSTYPFLFKITGRTKNYINAFGEELIIDNAEKALAIACLETNASINEYTAAPIYFGENNVGAHEWLIEFEKEPSSLDLFISILDQTLKNVNSDYEAKRSYDLSLQKPIIHALPKNSFYAWLQSIEKSGGQNKIPRLANNRKYVDSILCFMNAEGRI